METRVKNREPGRAPRSLTGCAVVAESASTETLTGQAGLTKTRTLSARSDSHDFPNPVVTEMRAHSNADDRTDQTQAPQAIFVHARLPHHAG